MTGGGNAVDLPATIPVFPLYGVLLLPRGRLPLNVFEPRYLNMVTDALSGSRLIGMVQPTEPETPPVAPNGEIRDLSHEVLPLHRVGCAGRIVAFDEDRSGRIRILLLGVCRFRIAGERPVRRGYRRVIADWSPFRGDLEPAEGAIDRSSLVAALRRYLERAAGDTDWAAIERASDETLVTTLAMACPFAASEKQALLEAPDLCERARVLTALLEMATHDGAPRETPPQ